MGNAATSIIFKAIIKYVEDHPDQVEALVQHAVDALVEHLKAKQSASVPAK